MKTKKILVTGASGFIGRYAVPLLEKLGHEVVTPSSREWNLLEPGAPASLIEAVRPTHLLHLAWYVEHGKYWTSPLNEDWKRASQELLQAFQDQGGVRAVCAGTCAEYDWSSGLCVEGETPLEPTTPYGVAKKELFESMSELKVSWAWGRVFFLYGPGENSARLVPSVAASLLRGEVARCSDGEQIRDFLHVEDVARGFVSLLESDFSGAANIVSGEPVQMKEMIRTLARILGAEDRVELGALPRAKNDPDSITGSPERIHSTGWRPRYSLEDGLRQVAGVWKESELK